MAFKDWLDLTRFEHALMVFFAVIASQAIVLKRFEAAFALPAVGPALITLAAFALNDFFGAKGDKINKRLDRPIAAGKIRAENALRFALLLYAAGLLACFFLANAAAFQIALVYAFLSGIYDLFLKRIPFAGNAFIASAMGISFIYGNYATASPLSENVEIFSVMAFFAGLGREFLITLRDVKGDKKIGALTMPMVIGAQRTVILANAFFYCAILVSLLPLLKSVYYPYIFFIVIADALFILTAFKISLDSSVASLKHARNYTLWALIIGLLAFASLAFK